MGRPTEGSTVNGKPGIRRGVVQIVGFVALAAVPVLALNSLATADTVSGSGSSTSGAAATRPARPQLTDAQKQCLADHGVTVPAKPEDGSRPEVSQVQRDALRQAAEACGLPTTVLRPGHRLRPELTDAQKQCLADQGVTVPAKPTDASRPEFSQAQRDALRQAADACGLPAGPRLLRAVRGSAGPGTA
jgi:hypothetical protein